MIELQTPSPQLIDRNGGHAQEHPSHQKISDVFAENVFSLITLKQYVSEATYSEMKGVVLKQEKIQYSTARNMAQGLIRWAMEKEVTHYTHWFQPLTNTAAEKHDAFYTPTINLESKGIESLSADELVQREPDGSSFPSGGLRETHSARGYTIWDPSSPAFIRETQEGKTLYIPAVFISYTGESLDYKTPLLKANHALNKAATAVCQFFDKEVTHVFSTLGWEQEYFLVDEKFYNARPDLLLAGRTLTGSKSAKGQQMDDHYFGSIPVRVQDFMKEFELDALKLGIPIITRHNEVAPGQYECAPMFEETNVAVDHNVLIMDLMEKTAIKHGFRILFNEKPFAGLNGSGKHCNWSMATSTGKNLLKPGDHPTQNLPFLTFFINILKAVHDHNDLLRASIGSAGNDHRLGANEAPPAIISVFTGSRMEQVLKAFKKDGLNASIESAKQEIDLGLTKIPTIQRDHTDRNRTSPFPFTDNRFEYRAVGASANPAAPVTVLNTVVSDQLDQFRNEVERLNAINPDQEANIVTVLQRYLPEVERIVFNGNGYSKEWEEEAAQRGLSNNKTTPVALQAYLSESSKAVFASQGVLNENELHGRYHVLLENYIHKVGIEAELYQEISRTYVLPAAYQTINRLSETFKNLKEMGLEDQAGNLPEQVVPVTFLCEKLNKHLLQLKEAISAADRNDDPAQVAIAYAETIKPYFDKVRSSIDKLEGLIDEDAWNLPKYRELLFLR